MNVMTKRKLSIFVHSLEIVRLLENNKKSYLRQIARNLNLPTFTVSRCLKILDDFVVMESINGKLRDLPNLPTLIRLKDGVKADNIIRYLRTKDKLGTLGHLEQAGVLPALHRFKGKIINLKQ